MRQFTYLLVLVTLATALFATGCRKSDTPQPAPVALPAASTTATPSAPAPAPSASSQAPQRISTQPPAAPAPVSETVYVTRTGDCYHRAGCSSLRRSSIATNLSDARQSYRPCQRCRPPE